MSQPDDEVLGKAYDHRLARRLLTYLKPYRGRVALAIPLIALTAGFELLALNLTMAAIDLFLLPPAPERLGLFSRLLAAGFEALGGRPAPMDGVAVIGSLYLGLMVVVFALTYWQTLLLNGTGQFVMYDLRRELFAKFQRLPLSYYDRTPIGRMTTRLTSDVDALNELFTSGFVTLLSDVVVLVGLLTFLFLVNWKLALVSLVVVPLLAAITAWFRRHASRTYREVRTRLARINAFLQEHLSGMATVQLFNREAREGQAFEAINDAHRQINIETILLRGVLSGDWFCQQSGRGACHLVRRRAGSDRDAFAGRAFLFHSGDAAFLRADSGHQREVQHPSGGDGCGGAGVQGAR